MRIFIASHSSANTVSLPDSRIWYNNFNLTLEKMGVDLVLPSFNVSDQHLACVYGKSELHPNEARTIYSERLWHDVKKAHSGGVLDLFFSYYYSASIDPEVINRIKGLGIPTVNFFCNSIHQFNLVAEIAPYYDYCIFPERDAEKSYLEIGANPIHIQMAANPEIYQPYDLSRIYEVTFVGQNYLNREWYLAYLLKNRINCHAWGPKWNYRKDKSTLGNRILDFIRLMKKRISEIGRMDKTNGSHLPSSRCHPPLSDDELVKMYSRSKISLGFSEVCLPDGSIKRHVRLRDFEATMSGALFMTGYQDELEEYFVIGKEIICYDTREELLEKTRYLLSHEDEANKVRKAGFNRARHDHSWEHRFQQLFQTIGL